jgi:triacylglycerol esterase/lipase EstA (alpha/beta hydrolase family)
MGGNLARVYSEVAGYWTINRLVTINTPHLGSPLANRSVELRDEAHP